jgi:membrane protein implicated in regulation of membrane protease activity
VKGQTLKIVLWSGSVGLIAVVLRRLFRRRQKDVNVGNVSEDWLAQHRGTSDTTQWN